MKRTFIFFSLLTLIKTTNGQNVGIGTPLPVAKFEVRGSGSNPAIPGPVSSAMFRIGVTANEGIDFGKLFSGSFAAWIQAGYDGITADPLVLQPSGGSLGVGTTTPHPSALLDVNSTKQGLLPPRMTAAQRTAISGPAEGLLVYQTNDPSGFYYVKSGIWTRLSDAVSYPSVTICAQQWMERNLDITTYRNGDQIPYVPNAAAWNALTTGAWCYYNNDPSTSATYGKLYNWYAVNDPRGLAPAGWHVPTDHEWNTLSACLGGDAVSGGKLKLTNSPIWASPNTGATNSSGFAALPAGSRIGYADAASINAGAETFFWSSGSDINLAYYRLISYNNSLLQFGGSGRAFGLSVRCVRN